MFILRLYYKDLTVALHDEGHHPTTGEAEAWPWLLRVNVKVLVVDLPLAAGPALSRLPLLAGGMGSQRE